MDGNTTQEDDTWDNCNAKNTIGTAVEGYELRWCIPSLMENENIPWVICGEDDES